MSDTEIMHGPFDVMEMILDRFSDRVESIEIEREVAGRVCRQRVRLRGPSETTREED